MLPRVHHDFLHWGTSNGAAKSKYNTNLARLLPKQIYASFTDEELMSKKLIKFRLGGHGHTLTILELARRLGLYISDEIHDEGFDTYFLGGLRNDDHFNAN
nr:hypothetical protein [Tanacetum cinerariifolium]